jgi:hypothetical protein
VTSGLRSQLQALGQSQDLLHLKKHLERRAVHKQERFNVFDALRVTWLELPHSNFLAALLDPSGNHKMGDAFLRAFLRATCPTYNPSWVLNKVQVRREWEHIDISLIDETNGFAVIIENKITSPETGDQLKWYWSKVKELYPGLKRVGVFLTPGKSAPSYRRYKRLDYNAVERLLGEALEESRGRIDDYAREAIEQYRHVLRRHIVNDYEVAQLSREIYHKHGPALKAIREEYNRWLKQTVHTLNKEISRLIDDNNDAFFMDESSDSNYIRFGFNDLRNVPGLDARGLIPEQHWWTPSGQNLLFVFENSAENLQLGLHILADRTEIQRVLDRLEQKAKSTPPFGQIRKSSRWLQVYRKVFLTKQDFESWDEKKLLGRLHEEWRMFLAGDFTQMHGELKSLFQSSDGLL